MVYLRMDQYDLALEDYDRALKLQPKSAGSLYGRGFTKHRLGRLAEAEADIKAAKTLQKDIAETWAEYGLTLEPSAVVTSEGPAPH
jgi:tetratricopeptide (TPR) repeat protein